MVWYARIRAREQRRQIVVIGEDKDERVDVRRKTEDEAIAMDIDIDIDIEVRQTSLCPD